MACPFSAQQCETLAQAQCQLENNQWLCADGDAFEFDEGSWRTEQIEKLKNLIPQLQEHPSLASLKREYDQIRMTGLWKDGDVIVSINRIANTQIEIEAWWPDAHDTSGFWFPVVASYQGGHLDWGAGKFDHGLLEADLRVVGADGAQVQMRMLADGILSASLHAQNRFGSKIQKAATLKRVSSGSLGNEKVGFRDRFYKTGFNGVWAGELKIQGCEATHYREGLRPFKFNIQMGKLSINTEHFDITDPAKPTATNRDAFPLLRYDLYLQGYDSTVFTGKKLELRSHSEQWGSASHEVYELSEDSTTMTYYETSSMFGSALGCVLEGTFKRQ